MSGHSKWATIKHKKGAADAKRGKLWSKIAREITIAAKLGGGDMATNARLRLVITKAKQANMPNDNIDRAIKKGTGEGADAANFEELTYEGYGPGGVAIMLDITTDNKNRTAAEIRSIFSKHNGSLGESGCVAWSFDRKALITIDSGKHAEDEVMEVALEAGAEDVETEDGTISVTGPMEAFSDLVDTFKEKGFELESADITRIPQNNVKIEDAGEAKRLLKLLDLFEDHDDVQSVSANFDIPDEIMEEVQA